MKIYKEDGVTVYFLTVEMIRKIIKRKQEEMAQIDLSKEDFPIKVIVFHWEGPNSAVNAFRCNGKNLYFVDHPDLERKQVHESELVEMRYRYLSAIGALERISLLIG